MNICMFTNTFLPHVGGVARSVATFAEDLRAMGHAVLVVAPTFDGQPDNEDEGQVLRVAAIQHFNGSDFSVRMPFSGLMEPHISRFRPDIIHSHHPFLLGDTALRTADHFSRPLIFTHHTLYERYTHYVPFDSDVMKRFAVHLGTEYANLCSAVIAPSNSIRDLLLQRGVKPPVTVLPTGIDLQYFRDGRGGAFREKHNLSSDIRIIGHTGRLAHEKNLPYLASAVCNVLRKRNDCIFVIAGTGNAEEKIKSIFRAQKLLDRIIMPGILQGPELADCYRAMDLFVFASQSETQGLVLMEAMAAGVPVLALRASGVSDVVEDGRNGRILPADCSAEEFGAAIEEAFARDAIDRWSQAARVTVEKFSRQNCAKDLLALYETTLRGNVQSDMQTDVFDTIRRKLKVEWELLQEKASAIVQSLS